MSDERYSPAEIAYWEKDMKTYDVHPNGDVTEHQKETRVKLSWYDRFFLLGIMTSVVWALSDIRAELKQLNSHIAVELKPEKPEGK